MCLCFLKFCLWAKLFSRQAGNIGHSTESHKICNMLAGFCEKTNACLGTVKEDDLFDHLTARMTVLLPRTWLHGVSLHMLLRILYLPPFDTSCLEICPTVLKLLFQLCSDIRSQYLKIFDDFHSSLLFLCSQVCNLCALFLWCFEMLCDFHYGFPHFCLLCQPVLSFIWTKFCAVSFMRSTTYMENVMEVDIY